MNNIHHSSFSVHHSDMAYDYDILFIGGGPGGYVAAIRAAQMGAKTAVVETDGIGGTCVLRGCIPSKALIRGAELVDIARHAKDYGVNVGEISVDFSKMSKRKETIVKTLTTGAQGLLKSNGIPIIWGKGKFVSTREVEVTEKGGTQTKVSADKIVIATGSVPSSIPIPGIDSEDVINSDKAFELKEIPQSVVIIGGGYIGVEWAIILGKLGSKVTIVEMLPQIVPTEDEEIAMGLQKILQKDGVEIHTKAQVKEIGNGVAGHKTVAVITTDGEKKFSAQIVLVAVGRRPLSEEAGLEKVGVALDRGAIVINDQMETNVPGIYAIGDVTRKIMLAHAASHQGIIAVENALGEEGRMNYNTVPRCIYTLPEVASVGLTEKQAREKVGAIKVGKFPFAANSKATILGERDGFIKIVTDAKYGEILGIHILGPHATDMIAEAVLAMNLEATAEDIARSIHAHPTLTEAMGETALDVFGKVIHMPPRK
jgi:dihydrolipoamide dehydrogenase